MLRFAGVLFLFTCAACAKSSGSSGSATTSDSTAAPECPKDLSGSVGKSCPSNGQICSPSSGAVRMISCSGGKWVELNAPPPPPPPPPPQNK